MTMKALYQHITGDTGAHQRAIDARVKKLNDRMAQILRARCDGRSIGEIAARYGLSRGAVDKYIRRALHKIMKNIAGEPRYSVSRRRADVEARRRLK